MLFLDYNIFSLYLFILKKIKRKKTETITLIKTHYVRGISFTWYCAFIRVYPSPVNVILQNK